MYCGFIIELLFNQGMLMTYMVIVMYRALILLYGRILVKTNQAMPHWIIRIKGLSMNNLHMVD